MSKYVETEGVRFFKDGLKGFDKESFISFVEENQKHDRIPKKVSPSKAWKAVEKYLKSQEKKKAKE